MNNLNKRIGILLIISLFISAFTQVSAQDEQRMQRFKDEKVSFFNSKLEMNEEVSEIFWPIYEDLNNRRMKIGEEERSLMSYYNSNSENMTEKEIDETIDSFFNIQKKKLDLDLQYHEKFVEILGKARTMKIYTLEREFRLHILKKFRGGGHGPGGPDGIGSQGRGRGSGKR
jgi:hypothetical protein